MLLGYADQEYTRDTAESVPRAIQLYEKAIDLIEEELYPNRKQSCAELIDACGQDIPAEWYPEWLRFRAMLLQLNNRTILEEQMQMGGDPLTICDILNGALEEPEVINWAQRFEEAEDALLAVIGDKPPEMHIIGGYTGTIVTLPAPGSGYSTDSMLMSGTGQQSEKAQAMLASQYYSRTEGLTQEVRDALIAAGDASPTFLTSQPEYTTAPADDYVISVIGGELVLASDILKGRGQLFRKSTSQPYFPSALEQFCTVPNPLPDLFLARAKANLYKIRNCMNISGLRRQIEPYAAPTDAFSGAPGFGGEGFLTSASALQIAPTPYRYKVIVQRAKELVNYAMQLENSLLSALEKLDAAMYSELQARQDLALSRQSVRLQDLRIREAETGVDLAETQLEKAEFSVDQYDILANNPFGPIEQELTNLYNGLANLQNNLVNINRNQQIVNNSIMAAANTLGAIAYGIASANLFTTDAGGASLVTGGNAAVNISNIVFAGRIAGAQRSVNNQQANIQISNLQLSSAIRNRQYELQRDLAQFDVRLGNLQVRQAEQRVDVVEQEKAISELRVEQAQDTLNFLQTKFTNAEFYDWMSRELENIYSYFLQQATSMAKLAEQQLAFERQEPTAGMIQQDYWVSVQDNFAYDFSDNGNNTGVDRKGITGSARLLQDMTKLDLYGFETRRR